MNCHVFNTTLLLLPTVVDTWILHLVTELSNGCIVGEVGEMDTREILQVSSKVTSSLVEETIGTLLH